LTLALGSARLRAYSLALQARLIGMLAARGVAVAGGDADHGAFCILDMHDRGDGGAVRCAQALQAHGVVGDARGPWLRLCPDILTTDDELQRAAVIVARVVAITA
jgi:kynureninase